MYHTAAVGAGGASDVDWPAENSQREHFSDFGGDFLASLRKRSVQSNLSAGRIATAHPLLTLLACSMRSRVYVTVVCPSVRPSVCLSVPSVDSSSGVRL